MPSNNHQFDAAVSYREFVGPHGQGRPVNENGEFLEGSYAYKLDTLMQRFSEAELSHLTGKGGYTVETLFVEVQNGTFWR